jgi:hypothetical protein
MAMSPMGYDPILVADGQEHENLAQCSSLVASKEEKHGRTYEKSFIGHGGLSHLGRKKQAGLRRENQRSKHSF